MNTTAIPQPEATSIEASSRDQLQLFIGIFYFVLSVVILIFNLTVQYTIAESQDLTAPAYHIMLNLGVLLWLQVFVQAFGGLFSISHSIFHFWFMKIIGAVLNSCWVGSIAFTLLLAFNRFVVVCFPSKADKIFTSFNLNLMIGLLWIWPVASFFVMYLTPFTTMRYAISEFVWSHDKGPWSPVMEDCEVFSIIAMIALCAIFYIPVFYNLFMMKKKMLSGKVASVSERRVLFHGMSIFGYNFLLMFVFAAHKFLFTNTRWTFVVVNTLWILNSGINPSLYLIFNK
ncbi:hypothetical protein L596_028524 [Steinernema carpocapsae]|uniref:G-protein coupled receptors family 1 profile domain-containing protein n=1 Tax=Steinernema carpocapsae TaxID=34508 RepID=A0A4V5ZXX0_STECR|nr:hypothetical protein L596_028524 [Steinernema carpocapsae]